MLVKLIKSLRKDLFVMWAILTGVLAFLYLIGLIGGGVSTLVVVTSFVWMTVCRGMLLSVQEGLDNVEEAKETPTQE